MPGRAVEHRGHGVFHRRFRRRLGRELPGVAEERFDGREVAIAQAAEFLGSGLGAIRCIRARQIVRAGHLPEHLGLGPQAVARVRDFSPDLPLRILRRQQLLAIRG